LYDCDCEIAKHRPKICHWKSKIKPLLNAAETAVKQQLQGKAASDLKRLKYIPI
jgi:hypothetical protein